MPHLLSRRDFLGGTAGAAVFTLEPTTMPASPVTTRSTEYLLFTYFTGNGEDGLHLASSQDGLTFTALNTGKSYLKPEVGESKLMRDPCVLLGPDGWFHMVWTSSWTGRTIGYAKSRNFKTWSDQRAINLFGDPAPHGLRNCWAPEIVWDAAKNQYVIFWSSTITGRFPETAKSAESDYNHRLYFVTSKDLITFTEPKVLIDPGFNTIDGTFLRTSDGQLHLIVKDETKFPAAAKNLRTAKAESYTGPFGEFSPPFSPAWVEGPTAIEINGRTLVYFDAYTAHHYGAMETTDFNSWRDVTPQVRFPKNARHGTVLRVTSTTLRNLI